MSLPARLQDEAVTRTARGTACVLLVAALSLAGAPTARATAPQAADVVPATVRVGLTQADGTVKVETLALEDYVARVLSGEGQPKAAPAAQDALAIVIRTFTLANRSRHRAEGYDLCDTTHCQVLRPAHAAARAAAAATAGRVLLDRGRPAFVFYSAHNGGRPALASEVWPGAVDYAPGDDHDGCDDEPGWTSEIATADVERALRAAGLTGRRLHRLRILDRTPSGRAGRMQAEGFTPDTITAHEFRMAVGRTLGWQRLRSTAFGVTRDDAVYRFEGVGYGHGVGLCVVGAGKRALRGDAAAAILRAYFRDLTLTPGAPVLTRDAGPVPVPVPVAPVAVPVSPPAPVPALPAPPVSPAAALATDIRLTLPPAEEHDRAMVLGLARQTRDAVAARALVPAPSTLAIQVHPSMEAFGHATGQPWWITGTTVGTSIDLAPIAQLRQRGVLESTVRFEVASAVVAPHLQKAPAWVRVGAALFFIADPGGREATDRRLVCPTDAELLRPVSGGARREAMIRAEWCVRREIARGRRLTEIR